MQSQNPLNIKFIFQVLFLRRRLKKSVLVTTDDVWTIEPELPETSVDIVVVFMLTLLETMKDTIAKCTIMKIRNSADFATSKWSFWTFKFSIYCTFKIPMFFRLQLICPFLVVPHAYPASLKYALYAHIYTDIQIFNRHAPCASPSPPLPFLVDPHDFMYC